MIAFPLFSHLQFLTNKKTSASWRQIAERLALKPLISFPLRGMVSLPTYWASQFRRSLLKDGGGWYEGINIRWDRVVKEARFTSLFGIKNCPPMGGSSDNGTTIYLLSHLLLDRHQHGQRSQDSDRTALVAQR